MCREKPDKRGQVLPPRVCEQEGVGEFKERKLLFFGFFFFHLHHKSDMIVFALGLSQLRLYRDCKMFFFLEKCAYFKCDSS